jgi:hypothetical protein
VSSSSSESKKLHEEAILDSCVTFTFFGVGGSGSLQATRRAATSFSSSSIGISISRQGRTAWRDRREGDVTVGVVATRTRSPILPPYVVVGVLAEECKGAGGVVDPGRQPGAWRGSVRVGERWRTYCCVATGSGLLPPWSGSVDPSFGPLARRKYATLRPGAVERRVGGPTRTATKLCGADEDFQFNSKNDSLLLFVGLDGNALTLAKAQAEGGTAAETINRMLGHIADLHGAFLRTVLAASSPTSGDAPPTTSSSTNDFATPATHPVELNLGGGRP